MSEGDSASTPTPVRRGRALGWLSVISLIYLLVLWYLDRDRQVLARLRDLAAPLGGCALLVMGSYVLRYQRWHRVLLAQGHYTL